MRTDLIQINNCGEQYDNGPVTIKELYEWAVANGLENNYMSDVEGNVIYSLSYHPWNSLEEIKGMFEEEEDIQNTINSEFSVALG